MFISDDIQGIEAPKWLQVVHAVNELRPETFGEPTSTGTSSTGRYVEEYPEARITMPGEAGRFLPGAIVVVEGRSAAAQAAITLAVERLGF